MSSLAAVLMVLIVGAITPGPNTFMVMQAGASRGLVAAGATMFGVLLGSFALLAIAWSSIGLVATAFPAFTLVLGLCGSGYLGWLGVLLVRGEGNGGSAVTPSLPSSTLGVALFQMVNPKAWLLIATAIAAMPSNAGGAVTLAVLMVCVTGLCLGPWAIAGAWLSQLLMRADARRRFDMAMGLLLLGSASALLFDAIVGG